MESLKLENYLTQLKTRQRTKHKSRLEEIIEPNYKSWRWTDETFFKDMTFLWVSLRRYMRNHTEYQLSEIIRWASDKDLHVRQFISTLK